MDIFVRILSSSKVFMEQYTEYKTHYNLGDNLHLEQADTGEFSIWYTIYKNINPYFRFDWDRHLNAIPKDASAFFILEHDKRIAGVMLKPNLIGGLFLIPPYLDLESVLKHLLKLLKRWSDHEKNIVAFGIPKNQIPLYEILGFSAVEKYRCMIRPTEQFSVEFPQSFFSCEPDESHQEDIIDLLSVVSPNEIKGIVNDYFKEAADFKKDSVLLYSKDTNRLTGMCLISSWEQAPLIYELAVHPDFQHQGLGETLLKSVINNLYKEYDFVRLFVKDENPAERLYEKLGFLSGDETANMILQVY